MYWFGFIQIVFTQKKKYRTFGFLYYPRNPLLQVHQNLLSKSLRMQSFLNLHRHHLVLFHTETVSQKSSSGKQSLYGIIQGGVYEDLRKIACEETCSKDFDGLAIGGSLGSTKNQMYDIFFFV